MCINLNSSLSLQLFICDIDEYFFGALKAANSAWAMEKNFLEEKDDADTDSTEQRLQNIERRLEELQSKLLRGDRSDNISFPDVI